MLTIGIPLRKPNTNQLNWVREVISRVREPHPNIHFVISIHSSTDDPLIPQAPGVTVLHTSEQYSYDENVHRISQAARTRYWMLLACTDRLVMMRLPDLLKELDESPHNTTLFFTGAKRPENCSQLLPERLGFLSSYVFNSDYFRRVCPMPRNYRGWIHAAVFLMALQSKEQIKPLYFELVEEDLEPGFIKPWTAKGGYLVYQVSLARLINQLLPRHPARAACESQAIGRWPFDIIKAVIQGLRLTNRERRYIASWHRRQGGYGIIFFRLLAQIRKRYLHL